MQIKFSKNQYRIITRALKEERNSLETWIERIQTVINDQIEKKGAAEGYLIGERNSYERDLEDVTTMLIYLENMR